MMLLFDENELANGTPARLVALGNPVSRVGRAI